MAKPEAAWTEADFQKNPELFVAVAQRWAAGGASPTHDQSEWLSQMPRPVIILPASARESLWGVLSYPERGKALSWLDRAGLLEELIPSWSGEYFRQALRLQAVEEVHLENWTAGLCKDSFDWLCVYQDQRVDSRMNGWALTGLATLLLSGDEPAAGFAARVIRDLKALGATADERGRIEIAILEYPELYDAIVSGKPPIRSFSPTTIVATLATIHVIPHMDAETRARAGHYADQLLLRFAAPDHITSRVS